MSLLNQSEDQADVSSMFSNRLHPFSKAVLPCDILFDLKSDPSVSKVVQQLGFVVQYFLPLWKILLNPSSRGLPLKIRKDPNQILMRLSSFED